MHITLKPSTHKEPKLRTVKGNWYSHGHVPSMPKYAHIMVKPSKEVPYMLCM